jgi:peptidoglycan/LPS O-acetylase OafA/YrhL
VRLAPIDGLRGLAALGVAVLSHYQHFGGDKAAYPFANVLAMRWMYNNAWLFVDFFFLLSGVVLTYRYLEPIGSGAIDGRRFFDLRLSRLYPLHVATLCICAAIQWTLLVRHHAPVLYGGNNDLYHFTLQLFYLHTFFERGWSFNEPSWSVSGEILVYLLFFLYARRARANYVVLAIATVIVGIAAQQPGSTLPILNGSLGRAMVGFFVGSLGFLYMRKLDRRGSGTIFGWVCLALLTLVCVLIYLVGFHELLGNVTLGSTLAVFPLVIFAALRVSPLARLLSLRPFTFLGDISYAVYLCHVPLQMIVMTVMRGRGTAIPTASPWMLAGYLVALVATATAAHYGFERPMRRWFRRRTGQVAVTPDVAAAA